MIIKKKNATQKPKQQNTEEIKTKIAAPKPSPARIPESLPPAEPEVKINPEQIVTAQEAPAQNLEAEILKNLEPEPMVQEQAISEPIPEPAPVQEPEPEKEEVLDLFEGFDLQNIDFTQRQERRRGDRRRGYRRVDDRNLVSRAQAEAISIKEKAYQDGFNSGLLNAEETMEDLRDSIAEFMSYKHEIYEKMCNDFLDLSVKIAEKIIKKEVKSSKSVLKNIILSALENIAKGETKIILKVAPSDVEYTKELVPGILSTGQIEAKIYVTGDDKVEEGSVIIETSNGLIDANIDTQLEVIKESFKQISSPDLSEENPDEEDFDDEDDEDDEEDDDDEDEIEDDEDETIP